MRPRFIIRALVTLVLVAFRPVVGLGEGSSRALAQELPSRAQVSTSWSAEKIDLALLFDAVIDTVNKNFFDQTALANWRVHAQALRPSVLASPSIGEAVRQINELLGQLGTSHTALYTPDDYQYYILLDIIGSNDRDLAMRGLIDRRFWGNRPYYPGLGIFTLPPTRCWFCARKHIATWRPITRSALLRPAVPFPGSPRKGASTACSSAWCRNGRLNWIRPSCLSAALCLRC